MYHDKKMTAEFDSHFNAKIKCKNDVSMRKNYIIIIYIVGVTERMIWKYVKILVLLGATPAF